MQIDKDIIKQICEHDVISFDIFDTIALRPFLQPRDLWLYIERKYNLSSFYYQRAKCDVGEYASIDEQYSNMPKELLHIKELECNLEIELSITNQYVKSLYELAKKYNKTIIIASDMYLTENTINKILIKHGILYDKLYLSNKAKASKSNGTLFQLIKKDYPNHKILHIGDNLHSDVHMAQLNNIDALHIENVCQTMLQKNVFLIHFLNKHNTFENRTFIANLLQAAYNFEIQSILISSYWTKLGEIIGSMVIVLMMQLICKYIEKNNIQNVLFVGRDGYALKAIFDLLCINAKSYYVYVIRSNTTDQQKLNYINYIKSFHIEGQKNVVVDLTTQNLSAKKTISDALSENIDQLTFITIDGNDPSKAVTVVNKNMFWLCMLIECLFRSPEFPITSIEENKPMYNSHNLNMFELFFVETANWMLNIYQNCAVYTYKKLKQMDISLNGQEYIDFLLLFMLNLSDFEKRFFKTLMHLSDGHIIYMIPPQLLK